MKIKEQKYPEFNRSIERILTNTCFMINNEAKQINSKMPYKSQYMLEEIIKRLQKLV